MVRNSFRRPNFLAETTPCTAPKSTCSGKLEPFLIPNGWYQQPLHFNILNELNKPCGATTFGTFALKD